MGLSTQEKMTIPLCGGPSTLAGYVEIWVTTI